MSAKRPRLGASTCLLGDPVRYDGGHKHDRVYPNPNPLERTLQHHV